MIDIVNREAGHEANYGSLATGPINITGIEPVLRTIVALYMYVQCPGYGHVRQRVHPDPPMIDWDQVRREYHEQQQRAAANAPVQLSYTREGDRASVSLTTRGKKHRN